MRQRATTTQPNHVPASAFADVQLARRRDEVAVAFARNLVNDPQRAVTRVIVHGEAGDYLIERRPTDVSPPPRAVVGAAIRTALTHARARLCRR